jgi:hypothetical protein
MKLSMFAVVHARGDASTFLDDPLVHCYAGNQLVLTYISRQALMDYFGVPGDSRISLQQWNLVVDRNLDSFKHIIEVEYERDDWEVHNAFRQSYPKLDITLADMRASGQELTIEVLSLDASGARASRRAARGR